MEAVSGIASLSQLAAYVNCTIARLSHLCKIIRTASFLAKSQLEELHVLLKILERVEKHHSPSDTELLVPVLISIVNTVQILENWFSALSKLRLQLNLIAHNGDIEEALRLLRRKYNLLAFYYTERNSSALNRIESSLNAHSHAAPESSANLPPWLLKQKSRRIMSDMDKAGRSTAPQGGELVRQIRIDGSSATPQGGELMRQTPINGRSATPQGRELGPWTGEPASFPSASGSPSEPSTAGAESGQFSWQREEGPSKQNSQGTTKFRVEENKFHKTDAKLFNGHDPKNNLDGEYKKNKAKGGSVHVGNAGPYQGSNGHS